LTAEVRTMRSKIPKGWNVRSAAVLAALVAFLHPLASEPIKGYRAPPLKITKADGRDFDLSALRGHVVLVNFWATWCGPCLAEMPSIERFYRTHHGQGFEVIALSVDRPQDSEKMRRFLSKLPYPGALASDAARNGFGLPEAVPLSYVIDAKGNIRDTFIGIDDDLLDEVILPLLKEASHHPIAPRSIPPSHLD
jgi:cytochrome c biogenesis protein CcmG/thiol:disulfide interchange protein DsbE